MKIYSRIISVFAAFMITAVFLMPVMVYAESEPETLADEVPESVAPDEKPFTLGGQASVIDLVYEGDGKMFYTFKTPAGNVFYLVIDRERGGDNVYFLNVVTEDDLLALAEGAPKTDGASTSAIPDDDPPKGDPADDGSANGDTTENPDDFASDDDKSDEKSGMNTGMIIFLALGAAAAVGVGYYVKVVRPKQQKDTDDDDDMLSEDDGTEMLFEDEPGDFDDYGDE